MDQAPIVQTAQAYIVANPPRAPLQNTVGVAQIPECCATQGRSGLCGRRQGTAPATHAIAFGFFGKTFNPFLRFLHQNVQRCCSRLRRLK